MSGSDQAHEARSGACSQGRFGPDLGSGGCPQSSPVGTKTGRGKPTLRAGDEPKTGNGQGDRDDKARKAPSVFRSGARAREAQNRRGGRLVGAPTD